MAGDYILTKSQYLQGKLTPSQQPEWSDLGGLNIPCSETTAPSEPGLITPSLPKAEY